VVAVAQRTVLPETSLSPRLPSLRKRVVRVWRRPALWVRGFGVRAEEIPRTLENRSPTVDDHPEIPPRELRPSRR
jgi:hypothetical protein